MKAGLPKEEDYKETVREELVVEAELEQMKKTVVAVHTCSPLKMMAFLHSVDCENRCLLMEKKLAGAP